MKFIKKTLSSVATNAVLAFVLAKSGVSLAYGKITEKARAANMTLKEYVGNDENIGHISLVFYDVLPLAFKLGLRYDKFHQEFALKFKTIRSWIYKYDDEQSKEPEQKIPPVNEPVVEPVKNDSKKAEEKKADESFADFPSGDVEKPVKVPRKRGAKKKSIESVNTDTEKNATKPKPAVKTPVKKPAVKRTVKKTE